MQPPAGRIQIGDDVEVPGGRRGRVVEERLVATNGAWVYRVTLADGGDGEWLDFELRRTS